MVTHPFHPLAGERLLVLSQRRRGASRVYVCEGPTGSVALPEEATDRGPEPAQRPLTVEVLAELAAVVRAVDGARNLGKGF
ncbi:MAG: Y4bD/Y4pK family protein [Actinobacteria bacterium]|nr:Y4bD/Y4pK family protein [Actinomycetota bacterium]MCA1697629.1 Y4bD/Y4pK family protein [Actinomycetota bacterium]